jgi:uncharacterized membrane protein YdfJ with MMPL/SSD domain
MQPLTLLFDFISRFKYFVIVFWILAAGGTGYFVPKFLDSTTTSFTPPKSSPAFQVPAVLTPGLEEFLSGFPGAGFSK